MSWSMPTTNPWAPAGAPAVPQKMDTLPDMATMANMTAGQFAMFQETNWQQWALWQQQYAQWQSQYGEKYAQQMQVMGSVVVPPLPSSAAALAPVPPPEQPPPPPPPHENNQPLYSQPQPPAPGPPSNPHTGAHVQNNPSNQPWAHNKVLRKDSIQNNAINSEALNTLAEEERLFEIQFKKWEEEIEKWKKDNVNHPDKQAYKDYETKFEACRAQLMERRQQMIQKRKNLMTVASKPVNSGNQGNNYHMQQNFNVPPPSSYSNSNNIDLSQPKYSKQDNKNVEPQDRYDSYIDSFQSNINFNNQAQTSAKNFFPANASSKGIPGLDLVRKPEEVSSQPDFIDITQDEQSQIPGQNTQAPDYANITKGINSILGDEKIMNILSMVRNQLPPSNIGVHQELQSQSNQQNMAGNNNRQLNTHQQNQPYGNVPNNYNNRGPPNNKQSMYNQGPNNNNQMYDNQISNNQNYENQNYNNENYDNQNYNEQSYNNQNYDNNYNQQHHGNYPPPNNAPRQQMAPRPGNNSQYQQNPLSQHPPPRGYPPNQNNQQQMRHNNPSSYGNQGFGPNNNQQNRGHNNFPQAGNDSTKFNQNQCGPKNNQGPKNNAGMQQQRPRPQNMASQQNVPYPNNARPPGMPLKPVNPPKPRPPKWVEEPLYTPSVIVDYDHVPLRLKARDFIEPVHTFDYNHIPKDGERRRQPEPDSTDSFKTLPDIQYSRREYVYEMSGNKDFERRATRPSMPVSAEYRRREDYEERRPETDNNRRREDYEERRPDAEYKRRDQYEERRPDSEYRRREEYADRRPDPEYKRREEHEERRGAERRPEEGRRGDDSRNDRSRLDYRRPADDRDRHNRERYDRERDRRRDPPRPSYADISSRKRSLSLDKDTKTAKKTRESPTSTTDIKEEATKPHVVMIDDLLEKPGRDTRPPKIVIILRGPPGSGKSYLAKLIRDKEAEYGGSPRIMSIDDYFMADTEVDEKDPATGRMVKKHTLKYEYDPKMESTYHTSLLRAFKRCLTEGFFPFLIYEAVNEDPDSYADIYKFSKIENFQVYVCTLELDPEVCFKRNIHGRSLEEISEICKRFKPTPATHLALDATTLLQSAAIDDVTMEDVRHQSDQHEVENSFTSKWEKMDDVNQLARLDGTSKPLRPSQLSMEDYLQLDDWTPNTAKPGKKTVRWADIEERRQQEKMRAIGFVVGQTDWTRMTDPTMGSSALIQTKYIERVKRK